jgi:2,3-bisphosphoglycerate-dependent phosphoglycerate mutase
MLAAVSSLIALLICTPSPVSAQNVIFIVRHAEKEAMPPTDPPLSTEGKQRADTLRDMLKGAGVTAIITSPFTRTKETAKPLATALSLTPQVDPMDNPRALVDKIRSVSGGGNVLVVGHSDSIPQLLKALGHSPLISIADTEFDNLFVVTPGEVTRPRVSRLRYKR